MIERIIFISEKAVLSAERPPTEENIYFSLLAVPGVKGSLEDAYALMSQGSCSPLSLTLDIQAPLTAENIRFITSFLFIPSYLLLDGRPVINLKGDFPALLNEAATSLSDYLSRQGFRKPHLYKVSNGDISLFRSMESLTIYYRRRLQNSPDLQNGSESAQPIFAYIPPGETPHSAIAALQAEETDFAHRTPQLYSLIRTNRVLEKELQALHRKHASTEAELNHQQQYVEILRSDHATKELQAYYDHEYEILPLWYKRFGHILKALTGKRTFQSLFKEGVKKYKN